jgi:hypothetical protein
LRGPHAEPSTLVPVRIIPLYGTCETAFHGLVSAVFQGGFIPLWVCVLATTVISALLGDRTAVLQLRSYPVVLARMADLGTHFSLYVFRITQKLSVKLIHSPVHISCWVFFPAFAGNFFRHSRNIKTGQGLSVSPPFSAIEIDAKAG